MNDMEPDPENHFNSASPEQKLIILRAEMLTPLEIIQGCATVLRKHLEREESTESKDLIECVDGIAKSASKIKELLDGLNS